MDGETPTAAAASHGAFTPRHAYYAVRDPSEERKTFTAITAMAAYESLSLEELRYAQQPDAMGSDDCNHAYRPTDAAAAAAYEEAIPALSASSPSSDSTDRYRPTVCRDSHDYGRLFHSISPYGSFAHVSFEELRYFQTTNSEAAALPTPLPTSSPPCIGSSESNGPRYSPTLNESVATTNWPFLMAITAMDAYAHKSLEELRLEDRNAPINWRLVVAANRLSPPVSLMELRVRDAVGRAMDETPQWGAVFNGKERATQFIEPFTSQWVAQTIQETIDVWYPVTRRGHFRAYMDALVETGGGVLDAVPVSLKWTRPMDVIPRFTVARTDADEEVASQSTAALDAFAFLGFYCAQARLVVKLRHAEEGFHWATARAEILEGVGDLAASLVSRLVEVGRSDDWEERTSHAIAQLLDVHETRPKVVTALRDHTGQVREYVVACEQLALDILHLRSGEVLGRCHGAAHVVIESHIDSVFISDAHTDSTMSRAIRDEIERLDRALEGSRDWKCSSSGLDFCLVNPFPDINIARITRRVPCFTRVGHSPALDPYTRMSEIAFQNTIPAQPTSGNLTLWLPSDVVVHADGRAVFASYIYNLHPKSCRGLYRQLERVLTAMIPSFEHALWSLRRGHPITPWFAWTSPQTPCIRDNIVQRPMPPTISPPLPFQYHNRQSLWSLKGTQLQVVVRMEDIRVSASDPVHTASDWDPRGLSNDNIAAVGVHCYGAVNVAASSLGFMCPVNSTLISHHLASCLYAKHYDVPHFGYEEWLTMGSVSIHEGRSLVFPSTYRARVEEVKWQNLTGNGEDGFLKLIWFYLVAPGNPVLSTADVPPHEPTWSTSVTDSLAHKFDLPDSAVELILGFSHAHYWYSTI